MVFKTKLLFLGILLTSFSTGRGLEAQIQAATRTESDLQELFEIVSENLNLTMRACPERIWESKGSGNRGGRQDWSRFDVLFLSDLTSPRIWNHETGELSDFPQEQVPRFARSYLYTFPKIDGRNAVAIYFHSQKNKDIDANRLFRLIVHEGFHTYGQKYWKRPVTSRGTEFPVNLEPRLQRKMSFDRMVDYAQTGNPNSLEQSKFWFSKWTDQFPQEAQSNVDGLEGVAHYVDQMAQMISERGCQASEQELRQEFQENLDSKYRWKVGPTYFGLDQEAYALGAVAAFLLRFENSVPDWKHRVQNGQSPNQILLKNVGAFGDKINQQVKKTYQEVVRAKNQILKKDLGPILKNFSDPNYIRVVFPEGSLQGFTAKGFYVSTERPELTLVPMAAALSFQGSGWRLQFPNKSTFLSLRSPVCDSNSLVAVVPRTAFGKFSRLPGEFKTDGDGLEWYCGSL